MVQLRNPEKSPTKRSAAAKRKFDIEMDDDGNIVDSEEDEEYVPDEEDVPTMGGRVRKKIKQEPEEEPYMQVGTLYALKTPSIKRQERAKRRKRRAIAAEAKEFAGNETHFFMFLFVQSLDKIIFLVSKTMAF